MLAIRIIPTLLFNGDRMVKGKQFNGWRSVGHIRQAVEIYASRQVDELILLDIGATPEGRGPDFARVKELTDIGFTPITVGGGVSSIDDAQRLFDAGADKVAVCTSQFPIPSLVERYASKFGCQAIVAPIDSLDGKVMKRCGTAIADPTWMSEHFHQGYVTASEWAAEIVQWGVGEILLTSIDREGTMEGYDIDLIREVSAGVGIPVIAHGGCGEPQHMLDAIKAGASAVAAGSMFHFRDYTPASCAQYLRDKGIEVRL